MACVVFGLVCSACLIVWRMHHRCIYCINFTKVLRTVLFLFTVGLKDSGWLKRWSSVDSMVTFECWQCVECCFGASVEPMTSEEHNQGAPVASILSAESWHGTSVELMVGVASWHGASVEPMVSMDCSNVEPVRIAERSHGVGQQRPKASRWLKGSFGSSARVLTCTSFFRFMSLQSSTSSLVSPTSLECRAEAAAARFRLQRFHVWLKGLG